MTQFNYQATEDFRSLILSICTSPSAYGDKNQVQAQLADLLSAGADPNAPSVQGRSVVLDDLTLFPSLAISLLDHGARLSSSGLDALRDNFSMASPITHNLFQALHPLRQKMPKECAGLPRYSLI